jgi:hypothetical protein
MLLAVVPSSCIVLRTEVLHTETLGRCALAGPPSGGGGSPPWLAAGEDSGAVYRSIDRRWLRLDLLIPLHTYHPKRWIMSGCSRLEVGVEPPSVVYFRSDGGGCVPVHKGDLI